MDSQVQLSMLLQNPVIITKMYITPKHCYQQNLLPLLTLMITGKTVSTNTPAQSFQTQLYVKLKSSLRL